MEAPCRADLLACGGGVPFFATAGSDAAHRERMYVPPTCVQRYKGANGWFQIRLWH